MAGFLINADDAVGENLKKTMAPSFFGISCNTSYFGFDLATLSSLRAGFNGTRTCVLVRFTSLASYVRLHSGPAAKTMPLSSTAAIHWMQQVTAEKLQEYLASDYHTMVLATVVAGDTLYIPAGWLLAERSGNGGTISGVRSSCLNKLDATCVSELQVCRIKLSSTLFLNCFGCACFEVSLGAYFDNV